MLSRQEAFDRALAGLRQQGRAATDSQGNGCFYRAEDGCRCAIGWLIPDDKYFKGMEGRSASNDSVLLSFDGDPEDRFFYFELQQNLHDAISFAPSSAFLGLLEKQARAFAKQCALIYTAPETVPC